MDKTVIIVDDEPAIRRLIKMALEEEGLICHVASDGEEGLSVIRLIKPDLVLLDVMMMKMNGLQVASAMNQDKSLSKTKIVILSARETQMGDVVVDDFLSKPFDLSDLVTTVQKHLL